MLKEFREFAMRGNVVDLAVGVIIGAAFGKITTSLVNDVIMPPIGVLLGKVDFSNLFFTLSEGDFASVKAARCRRPCRRLWHVHQHHHRFHHHRVCSFSDREANESFESSRQSSGRCRDGKRMYRLHLNDFYQGKEVQVLWICAVIYPTAT